jgi:hypoxanthine phosphoribosyltransferase
VRSLAPEILIPAERIEARVAELAAEITAATPEDGEIAALIVLKGAFVFAADLLRAIPRRVRVGFLETHRDPTRPGLADFVFTYPFPVEGADLLLIEDILDSGHTLRHLQSRMAARRPARLRTAILLDKKPRREVDVAVDHVGFDIPDLWVVGYGLDDGERYRNLRHIGYVLDDDESDR